MTIFHCKRLPPLTRGLWNRSDIFESCLKHGLTISSFLVLANSLAYLLFSFADERLLLFTFIGVQAVVDSLSDILIL